MKILAVNGSPRGAKGNTQIIVDAFLEGAAEAGAESEVVYLKDKKIEHCVGCFNCWTTTPGVCIFKDDMPELLEKYSEADMVVFATPLYVYTVSGLMKDFMDRTIPLVLPNIDVDEGMCNHPRRHEREQSIVLISNSGFPEQEHFSGLKETVRRCFRESNSNQLAGMICCGGGVMLENLPLREGFLWYLDAAKQAGREIVTQKQISKQTQEILERPLVDPKVFSEMSNVYWNSVAAKRAGESQPDHSASGELLGAPASMDTVRDLVAGMALVFNSQAAGNMKAVIQFEVKDEEPGRYYLDIHDGKCVAYAGEHPKPTATIKTPTKVWVAIANGEMNGSTAFLTGKYKVSGDLTVLMRFADLFPQTF